MVKLSELQTAEEIHEQDMLDPEYRREYERTRLAADVAIKVVTYRAQHDLTQSQLARKVGMRQPHIARLEAGDHEPSLATLARLSEALGLDFSIDIRRGSMKLRNPAHGGRTASRRGGRNRSAEIREWGKEHAAAEQTAGRGRG